MYREHDEEHVVDVNLVWPLIKKDDPDYLAWLAEGNTPLAQTEDLPEGA